MVVVALVRVLAVAAVVVAHTTAVLTKIASKVRKLATARLSFHGIDLEYDFFNHFNFPCIQSAIYLRSLNFLGLKIFKSFSANSPIALLSRASVAFTIL